MQETQSAKPAESEQQGERPVWPRKENAGWKVLPSSFLKLWQFRLRIACPPLTVRECIAYHRRSRQETQSPQLPAPRCGDPGTPRVPSNLPFDTSERARIPLETHAGHQNEGGREVIAGKQRRGGEIPGVAGDSTQRGPSLAFPGPSEAPGREAFEAGTHLADSCSQSSAPGGRRRRRQGRLLDLFWSSRRGKSSWTPRLADTLRRGEQPQWKRS